MPDVTEVPPSDNVELEKDSIAATGPGDATSSEGNDAQKIGCLGSCRGYLFSLVRFLGHCVLIGCGFQLIVGTLLRLTIKDTIPHLSLFYYASPPILLSLAALILSLRQCLLKERRWAIMLAVVSLVMVGWWHWESYQHFTSRSMTENEVPRKVLFWNVSYAKAGWPTLIEEIQQHDPDIIGMVEVGHGFRAQQDWLNDAFPDHAIQFVGHGFVLVRGKILSHERGLLKDHGAYGVVRARLLDGAELDIILTDIYAYPFMPRGPAFSALSQVIEAKTEKPICLMGDFNTPPDSVLFDGFREKLEHSFEVAGEGYQVTWPAPVPVLCLDQIWLPRGETRSSRYQSTPHSDHRLVVAEFHLKKSLAR